MRLLGKVGGGGPGWRLVGWVGVDLVEFGRGGEFIDWGFVVGGLGRSGEGGGGGGGGEGGGGAVVC